MFSLEAEQSVLGALLIDPKRIGQAIDRLAPEDFFQRSHKIYFEAMLKAFEEKTEVDVITLGDYVQSLGNQYDLGYATELYQNCPGSTNIKAYIDIVLDKSKRRQLYNALDQCTRLITSSENTDIDDVIAQTASQIGAMQGVKDCGSRTAREIIKTMGPIWDRRLNSTGFDGLETGLKALDDRHNGWKDGDLVVAAGRPSMGKSVLGVQIAFSNAIKNKAKAMIFSLEMTSQQLVERMTANIAKVHLDVFRKGELDAWTENSAFINAAVLKIAASNVIIDETPSLHINQICARARAEHRKEPLRLVVVDHIHLVAATALSREREMASITGSLKGLAKELNCPVLAIAQLNRAVEQRQDKRPQMSDLRDSGSIEQDADIIMLMYRDEYYNQDTMEKGVLEIITAKFREGETGTDYLKAMLHMSRIENQFQGYAPPPKEEKKQKRGFRD